ncbi:TadE/TadG family type IV pilus assembly protein [Sphingobium nicotianae]|uniref:Pilus assembly protein n=1 Tax=Sphingobium nicotianae TaxID=2782607 RepID=A0A9X1IR98_9SPHN|nr:TadE/TadG family type IV pilus assembly protein [Sphingobium nicotianae]MBT2187261.1 pilus assembly protein [Sphingobium nicotianae]
MRGALRAFWRDRAGASAAEFAMVLPLLLLFIFGAIDVGRLMWTWNEAEKATQMGVRFAVATDLVPSDLATYSYAANGVPQGDPVPESAFPGVSCDSATCACKSGGSCPFGMTRNGDAFNRLVARMAQLEPDIKAANVTVDYGYSGLGYAGDPNGPDVSPLVTVNLRNVVFQPITLLLFGASITLPSFSATLSLEDGAGTDLN